ncbi:MAG: single-stranded-DNA-specific exonuclease RecJ, partial [Chloroflexi bacterium]|nr:single-stranded-DNA-specific exonuclease RecJ [Chloroflexota bacterium]
MEQGELVSTPRRRWALKARTPLDAAADLAKWSPLLTHLLQVRGFLATLDDIQAFLAPEGGSLRDPLELPDMQTAIERIRYALQRDEWIGLYGDYDVDGITALAVLSETLSALGAEVVIHIPDRNAEGYGLHVAALRKLREQGVSLVIALDCGTNAVSEVAAAKGLGMDFVVVDHHEVTGPLAPAVAVINPKRPDSQYSFDGLATVGLAYKLAQALMGADWEDARFGGLTALVALGTVADVVPLLGENRALVKRGLVALRATVRIGLQRLIARSGLNAEDLDEEAIAFALAPRLNAAGRMAQAKVAYRLLLTNSEAEAEELADKLEAWNRQRQELTAAMLADAQQQVLAQEPVPEVLVVASPSFHIGVVGLVASRLVDEFARPAIVLEQRGEEYRGSARSVPGVDITALLAQCQGELTRFGGHAAAAGLALPVERLGRFRERLLAAAAAAMPKEVPAQVIAIDAALALERVGWPTYQTVRSFAPFGEGNPEPLFLSRKVRVWDARPAGHDGKHLRLRLSAGGS